MLVQGRHGETSVLLGSMLPLKTLKNSQLVL